MHFNWQKLCFETVVFPTTVFFLLKMQKSHVWKKKGFECSFYRIEVQVVTIKIIIKTLFQEGNTISTELISLAALKYLQIDIVDE